MPWYSFRTVLQHGPDGDGSLYEERIVLLEAPDDDRAIERARQFTCQYVSLNPGFVEVEPMRVFLLSEAPGNSRPCEVWSLLLNGQRDSEAFRQGRYGKYEIDD